MLRDQSNGCRKGVSNLYVIMRRLLSTGLPRFLQHIQHISLPWNAFVETQTAKTFILYDRQDIVLIEGALWTAADKTGMKNQRMQSAVIGGQALAAVQCGYVDKESVASIQLELPCARSSASPAQSPSWYASSATVRWSRPLGCGPVPS